MRSILPAVACLSILAALSGCTEVQINPNAKAIAATAGASAQANQFPGDIMAYTCREDLKDEPTQTQSAWAAVLGSRQSTLHLALVKSMVKHMSKTEQLINVHVCPDSITGSYNKLNRQVQLLDLAVSDGSATDGDYQAVTSALDEWMTVTAPSSS